MANARLLRQSIEDYQKKYDTTAKNFNARYKEYTDAVDGYNAEMDRLAKIPGAVAYVSNPDGTYSKVVSQSGKLLFAPKWQNIKGVKEVPTSRPSYGQNSVIVTEGPDKGVYVWDQGSVMGNMGPRDNVQPTWTREGGGPPLIYNQPVAPKEPDAIKAPNITVSGTRELQNPGLNQAQLNMVGAKGIIGKSELTGDQQPAMRGSVFAKQDDPQGLKERGVLARVLGGQL